MRKTERPYEDGKWRFLNFDNNIELLKNKADFNTIGTILAQGEEDYADLKEKLDTIKKEGGGPEDLTGKNIHFERMLLYPLFKNAAFRERFYKRFLAIENTVYDTGAAEVLLDRIAAGHRLPVVTGYSRWFGDRCSFRDFDEKVEEIREFLRTRRGYIEPFVKEACGF